MIDPCQCEACTWFRSMSLADFKHAWESFQIILKEKHPDTIQYIEAGDTADDIARKSEMSKKAFMATKDIQ